MHDTQELTVKLKAEGFTEVAQGATSVEARLSALEQAYVRASGSATAHTTAESGAAAAIEKSGAAASGASGALGILKNHWRLVGSAAEVAGVEASGAAVKIAALAEVVEKAEAAFPPLLAALIAFEAGMKSLELLREAAETAKQLQAQMETLGAAVENQGGNWSAMKGQVEDFVSTEAMASGFLRSELLPALNDLVTAGHNVADAETILAVAEEVAVAHHKDVREVVGDLIALELGRGRGIERLDPAVRALDQANASYSAKLQQLHKDTQNQIDADQSAERASNRLKVELEGVRKEIGDNLLPVMAWWDYSLLGGIENAKVFGQGVVHSFTSIVMAAQGVVLGVRAIPDAIAAAWDAIKSGRLGDAKNAFMLAAGADIQQAMEQMADARGMSDLGAYQMWSPKADAYDVGRQMAQRAMDAHKKDLDKRIKAVKPVAQQKEKKGKSASTPGSSESFSYTPIDPESSDKTDKYAQAQKDLEASLKRVDNAERDKAEAIKTATTVEGQAAAQAAYDAQVTIDLLDKKQMLTKATNDEGAEIKRLSQSRDEQRSEEERYRQAYNEFAKELLAQAKAGHEVSDDQKNDLAELKAHHDDAKKKADAFSASITTLTNNLRTNTTALEGVNAKLEEFKNKAAEVFGAASRSWEEYQTKQARSLQEDLDTWQMTNAQKIAYYADALAKIQALDADSDSKMAAAQAEYDAARKAGDEARIRSAQAALTAISQAHNNAVADMEQYDSKLTESVKAALRDRENEYKQFYAKVQGYETTFLDGILKQHQSLGQALKSVFAKMVDDYITSLETMLMKSSMMQALNGPNGVFGKLLVNAGILQAPGGSTGNPQLDAAIDARITGEQRIVTSGKLVADAHTNVTGAANTLTPALQQVTDAAQQAAAALRGVQGGSGGGYGSEFGIPGFGGGSPADAIFGAAGKGDIGYPFGAGTGLPDFLGTKDINIDSVGGKALTSANGVLPTSIEKMAGNAFQGVMIGQMIAGLDGGNSMWASVLGGVGGAFGGPVGSAIGGLIGSLFGNHSLGPSKQPDIYNPAWGQADVDWNGDTNQDFNGSKFSAASQYNRSMGGTPMYKLMEQWANAGAATTDAQKALQAQILKLEGGNPNADFGVVREANNIAYLADGQQISVPDLIAMEQAYTANVGTGPQSIPTFAVSRMYPDLNLPTMQQVGSTTTQTTTVGSGGSGTTATGGFTPIQPQQPEQPQVINIKIEVASGVVTATDLHPLGNAIGQYLQRVNNGMVPGAPPSRIRVRV